jgi:hypothetical protein
VGQLIPGRPHFECTVVDPESVINLDIEPQSMLEMLLIQRMVFLMAISLNSSWPMHHFTNESWLGKVGQIL